MTLLSLRNIRFVVFDFLYSAIGYYKRIRLAFQMQWGDQYQEYSKASFEITVLEWLWDAAVEPVLNCLGYTQQRTHRLMFVGMSATPDFPLWNWSIAEMIPSHLETTMVQSAIRETASSGITDHPIIRLACHGPSLTKIHLKGNPFQLTGKMHHWPSQISPLKSSIAAICLFVSFSNC